MTYVFVAIGVGLVIGIFILIAMYNKLVRLRVDCDNGWSQIDVQLKRRYDLIPNLVETVKGYATHEQETLDAVISARQQAIQIHDAGGIGEVAQLAQAEGMLTGALSRLMAVAEAYPDLKANSNFMALQEELTSTENKIGFSRQHYNDTVGRYETMRQSFPSNIVASAGGFKKRDYFEVQEASVREAPKVSFS